MSQPQTIEVKLKIKIKKNKKLMDFDYFKIVEAIRTSITGVPYIEVGVISTNSFSFHLTEPSEIILKSPGYIVKFEL